MLQLTIPAAPADELWDEEKLEFVPQAAFKGATLQLEHSLLAVRKWEGKWHKSFSSTFDKRNATADENLAKEFLDYIRCMTLSKNVDPDTYNHLTLENLEEINKYIHDPMTATTVHRKPGKGKGPSRKVVTAEQIYSWMIDCEIPWDAEKWHLNQLLTLIDVRNATADPGKKMSPKSIMKSNAALNAARRSKMHSKG